MHISDPRQPPFGTSDPEEESENSDRPDLKPSDAPGHTLPASESAPEADDFPASEDGMVEQAAQSEPVPLTNLPPD